MKWILADKEKPYIDVNKKYKESEPLLLMDENGSIETGNYRWNDDWKCFQFKWCTCCDTINDVKWWSYYPEKPEIV